MPPLLAGKLPTPRCRCETEVWQWQEVWKPARLKDLQSGAVAQVEPLEEVQATGDGELWSEIPDPHPFQTGFEDQSRRS